MYALLNKVDLTYPYQLYIFKLGLMVTEDKRLLLRSVTQDIVNL